MSSNQVTRQALIRTNHSFMSILAVILLQDYRQRDVMYLPEILGGCNASVGVVVAQKPSEVIERGLSADLC